MPATSELLPAELLALVTEAINTFVKWDVIRFLKDNSGVADTYAGIARYIGRTPEVVAPQLRELAADGLLTARRLGDREVFSLTDDPDTLELIHRFHTGCRDRQFRLRVVYHVARCMS